LRGADAAAADDALCVGVAGAHCAVVVMVVVVVVVAAVRRQQRIAGVECG
jgi:hypothetical protein